MPCRNLYHYLGWLESGIFATLFNQNSSRTMKQRILLTWFLALLSTLPAFALRFESGDNIRISQPVNEDIYVFGGTIYIDAPVHGDIWCAGGTVTINDTVTGDIGVGGGNIYLHGVVLDDVRAAGGSIIISGSIGGDLLVTGGNVSVESNGNIGGDVAISGGTATLSSAIRGNLKAAGGSVTLNGAVGKNFEFNGGDLNLNGSIGGTSVIAAKRILLGENAALRGNVRYWADDGEVNFGNTLQDGASATFDTSLRKHFERPDYRFLGFASFLVLLWYLVAVFILLWLGQRFFHKNFRDAADTAQKEPMRSLGYGFLYFAAVPVAVAMLLVSVVGIPVGLIVLTFYILFLTLANIITALVGAHWIDQRKGYNWRPIQLVLVALGLLVVLKLLGFIPFLGWIAKIVAVFIAFGAIVGNSNIFGRKQAAI